jgi:hypothetical protein
VSEEGVVQNLELVEAVFGRIWMPDIPTVT